MACHTEHDSDRPQGLVNKPEPVMTFYDARLSDSSDPPSTPEQRVRVRRPNPDNNDLRSLGSYTRPKPIPKKDKLVEEMKL